MINEKAIRLAIINYLLDNVEGNNLITPNSPSSAASDPNSFREQLAFLRTDTAPFHLNQPGMTKSVIMFQLLVRGPKDVGEADVLDRLDLYINSIALGTKIPYTESNSIKLSSITVNSSYPSELGYTLPVTFTAEYYI